MKYMVELTNDCNLSCEMCSRQFINMQIGYMTKGMWNSIVKNIPEGSTILPFWRGESTLHPDFCNMIRKLDGYDVVLSTNGTNPDAVIDVLDCFNVVNVSIHGLKSYNGYIKIASRVKNGKPKINASHVEGEPILTVYDRIYKRHTINGIWGKVEGIQKSTPMSCSRMGEIVIGWNGDRGQCCYVWDTMAPPSVCATCDQWMGNGRTL